MEAHNKEPSKRAAQHRLAREVLEIAHGTQVALQAELEHRSLFTKPTIAPIAPDAGDGSKPPDMNRRLNDTAPSVSVDNIPSFNAILPKSLVHNVPISRVIYHAGLVASRSEGHRMVASKGVYIGSRPGKPGLMGDQVDFTTVGNTPGSATWEYVLGGNTLIVRIGKWKIKIIKIVDDAEFEAQGLTAPGWKEETLEETSKDRRQKEVT